MSRRWIIALAVGGGVWLLACAVAVALVIVNALPPGQPPTPSGVQPHAPRQRIDPAQVQPFSDPKLKQINIGDVGRFKHADGKVHRIIDDRHVLVRFSFMAAGAYGGGVDIDDGWAILRVPTRGMIVDQVIETTGAWQAVDTMQVAFVFEPR